MPGLRFEDVRTFEENLEAFLAEMEGVDTEMAEILRANLDKIRSIADSGVVDRRARTEFNEAVAEALDALLAGEEGG